MGEARAAGRRLIPPAWRLVARLLVATSRLGLPAILILVLVSTDPPVDFATLVRLFTALSVLPALAALLIRRAFDGEGDVSKDDVPSRPWLAAIAKYPLFALIPTVVLFRVHQYISYGGAFGQWQMYGFVPYAATFAVYWTTITIYLVLYGGTLRLAGDGVELAATRLRPASAQPIRSAIGITLRIAYFAGVPILLALRFLG